MSIIVLSGDTHGRITCEHASKQNVAAFLKKRGYKESDVEAFIVLGDFGVPWSLNPKNQEDLKAMDWWKRDYPIYAIFGNHENYERVIGTFPEVSIFNDAKGFEITPWIHYIKRNQEIKIKDTNFLMLGGAESIDKSFRQPGISWWKEEVNNFQEEKDLLSKNYSVDYIFSHTCPKSIVAEMGFFNSKIKDPTSLLYEHLLTQIEFKKWYFGHFHIYWQDEKNKFECMYQNLNIVEV